VSAELTGQDYDEQWKRLYDFIKYNPGARHRRRLILRRLRHRSEPESVLDAGCGLGFTVKDLSTVVSPSKITGLDFSNSAIEWARERFPDSLWITGDLSSDLTSTLGRKYDLIVCSEVIEHLPDYQTVIGNLCSLLNDEGCLIITTQAGRIHKTEMSVGHLKHFTIGEIERILRQSGLSVLESIAWGWPGMTAIKYAANLNSDVTIRALGSGTYGILAKAINHVAYLFSYLLSLPNTKWGPQLLVLATKPTSDRR